MNIEGFNLSRKQINQSTAKMLLEANLSIQYSYYYESTYFKDKITIYRKNKNNKYNKMYILTDLNFNQYYNICSFLESKHIREYAPPYSQISTDSFYDDEEAPTHTVQKTPKKYYIIIIFLIIWILYFYTL